MQIHEYLDRDKSRAGASATESRGSARFNSWSRMVSEGLFCCGSKCLGRGPSSGGELGASVTAALCRRALRVEAPSSTERRGMQVGRYAGPAEQALAAAAERGARGRAYLEGGTLMVNWTQTQPRHAIESVCPSRERSGEGGGEEKLREGQSRATLWQAGWRAASCLRRDCERAQGLH